MKISPYLKVLLYVFLFLFIYMVIMASISIFITHSGQPAVFGGLSLLFMLSMALILVGGLQVKDARRKGERKSWYQQYETSLGLCLLCFLALFLDIGLFDLLPSTLLLRRVEVGILFLSSLLMVLFLFLSFKYSSYLDNNRKPQERVLKSLRRLRATVPVGSAEYEELSSTIRVFEQKQAKLDGPS